MTSIYRVGRIVVDQIEPAYLLVSQIAPAVSLDRWRASCCAIIGRKDRHIDQDDIAVATNPLGYVQGLCVSAPRRHVIHGRILEVSVLTVASAADDTGVADDLLRYLKAVAKAEACEGLHIWTQGRDDWTSNLEHPEIDRSHLGMLVVLHPNSLAER
jgi:hypothetical protein